VGRRFSEADVLAGGQPDDRAIGEAGLEE